MGLDCSHDAFHASYGAFNRLRQAVAAATGGSFPPHQDEAKHPNLKRWYWGDGYSRGTNPGLYVFLTHSDCDGYIGPKMCAKIADELEALLPSVSADSVSMLQRFIAGCRLAASRNERLKFD